MTDMSVWMGLLGAEVLLILFALLLVSWIRQNAAARRDRKAVATLIAAAKENRAQREQQIVGYLKKTFGMDDVAAEAVKVSLVREEFKLLQRFGLIYRNRDAAAASKFSMFVEAALEPYHDMSGGTVAAAAPEAVEGEVDASELEHLRHENKRLSEELSVTMDTMSRMLSEYSTMFADTGEGVPQAATEDPDSSVEPDGEALSQAEPETAAGEEDLPLREAQLEPEALDIGADEVELAESVSDEPMELFDDDEDGMDPETLLVDSAATSEPEPENEVLEIDEQVEREATSVAQPGDAESIDPDSAVLLAEDVDNLFESIVDEQREPQTDPDPAPPASDDEVPIDPDSAALLADDLDDLFDGIDEEQKERRKDQDDDTVII